MKKRGLGVLRCCAVSAILFTLIWGIIQPVSAGPVERPEQGRIVVDVPDVTQYYHQEEYEIINPATTDHAGTNAMDYASMAFFNPNRMDEFDASCFHKMHWGLFFEVDQGAYNLVAETGERGDVSGTFSLHAKTTDRLLNDLDWRGDTEGFEEAHEILVEGQIESGKAVYNSDGFLRVVSNKEYCDGSCGRVKVTYTFRTLGCGSYLEERIVEDSVSFNLEITSFYLGTNFQGESIFKVVSMADTVNDSFITFFMNDPNSNLGVYRELDFDDKGNEKEIPDFPGAGNYDSSTQEEEQPQLEEAPDLSDSSNAPFSISAGCDASLASGQDIDCSLNIQRNSEDIGPLTVVWIMDGYVASEEQVLGGYSSFHFPNPPPGSHTVQVQVVDSQTGNVRVAAMDVEVGGFASPDEAPDRIPAGAQTASAVGTTALIGAWLWLEWMQAKANVLAEDRRDAKEAKERQAWYEDQMERNDEVRARQRAAEAPQQALEAEWKRYRNALLETVKKHEKSEYLVDLLDDLHEVVYRDGKWDADGLQRLERMINSRLVLDREDEVRAEWKRMWDFNKRSEAELNSILRSKKMAVLEVGADLLTLGRSNLIFMPAKAICSAIYARRRAMMLGKTGTDAGWSVMKDAGLSLGLDYLSGKGPRPGTSTVIGKATIKYLEKRINVMAERGIADLQDDPERPVHLWQGTGEKLVVVPKPAAKLPVVNSSWGNGAQTNLASPVYRPPGNNALMRAGMENGLDRISQIDTGLADNVRRIIDEGAQVDPHINNVLSPGNPSYTLTPQDEIARNLINNSSYKEAVRDGLVPNRVQQAVYQTRDKIARNATAEAFRALDEIDLNGQPASSYLKNVTVSGTGARPLNPQAVGRFTDWNATVIARDSDLLGSAGRQAEELFKSQFDAALQRAGVNGNTAEVIMFPGVHASPDVPVPGGYSSEGLTHWHKVDMTSQGQSAVRLENGGVMFNAHPDVAPMQETLMKDFGSMEAAPRFQAVSGDVTADARRLVHSHVNARISETGGPIDPLAVLRMEGKHAPRVWKANNAGSGAEMPGWMDDVVRLKNDPNYHLSGGELDAVWKNYTEYMGLPPNLGGEG